MKIYSNVQPTQNLNIQHKKAPNNFSYQLKSDCFEKTTTNVSFKGLTTFAQKFEPFQKEFREYCERTTNFSLQGLSDLLRKYAPNVKVKDMSELPTDGNIHDRVGAYIRDVFQFTRTGKIIDGEKEIYIQLPNNLSKEELGGFQTSFIHEVTHYFQETSIDRVSKKDWLEKLLTTMEWDQRTVNYLRLLPQFFSAVEYHLNKTLSSYLRKNSELPIPIKDASEKALDKIFQKTTGLNLNNYIDNVIFSIGRQTGFPINRIEMKKLLEYINLVAQKELEANKNGTNFIKKTNKISSQTDLDLFLRMYEVLIKRTKFLSNQIKE